MQASLHGDSPAVPLERVAVGIVVRDGRVLVGLRRRPPLAGYAEFPGGRARAGETLEGAVVRELREETGLAVQPGRLLLRRRFAYPHATVDLAFFACTPEDAAARPRAPFRWLPLESLFTLRFPPANAAALRLLRG